MVGILTFISMINTTSERLTTRNFFICRYFSFMSSWNFVRSCFEHEKHFIILRPGHLNRLAKVLTAHKHSLHCSNIQLWSYKDSQQKKFIWPYTCIANVHFFTINMGIFSAYPRVVSLFDFILYIPVNNFSFMSDGSSWVEPVLSRWF